MLSLRRRRALLSSRTPSLSPLSPLSPDVASRQTSSQSWLSGQRARRAFILPVALPIAIVGSFVLSGCKASTKVAGPKTTVASTVATIVSTAPSSTAGGVVIETPSDIVGQVEGTAPVSDYTDAPSDSSLVLEATVPKITVYANENSQTVKTELDNPTPSGAPLVFLVDGMTSKRFKVLLPIRPNGSIGWIDPGQVKKYEHDYRVKVELSAHRITVSKGKTVILSEKIAVGASDKPTPNGRYYIKELLRACRDEKQTDGSTKCVPYADGIYGPYAYGLSGFSSVVKKFNGGEGVIGIHGTNQPALLGTDVSHGCIRMSNSGITQLSKILPLGTPVIVQP